MSSIPDNPTGVEVLNFRGQPGFEAQVSPEDVAMLENLKREREAWTDESHPLLISAAIHIGGLLGKIYGLVDEVIARHDSTKVQ